MPWTRKQVRYLESSGSPLTPAQKSKMNAELHADPAMGHAKKGSAELSRAARMRSDIAKFKGKSSEASFRRSKRKVLNRYA